MRNLRELLNSIDHQNNIVYINNITINNHDNLRETSSQNNRNINNLRESTLQNNRNINDNNLQEPTLQNNRNSNNNLQESTSQNNRNNDLNSENDVLNSENNNRNNNLNNNRNNNRNNNLNSENNNLNSENNNRNSENNNRNNSNMNLFEIDPILASATINLDDIQQNNIDSLSNIISEELSNLANSFNSALFNDRLRSGRRIVMTRELSIPRNTQNQEESRAIPVPLSSLNSKTELVVITSENKYIYNENCSICSLPIIENNIIRKIIICNHYFHQNCVDIWFSTNSTCPICRTNLITDNVRQNNENISNSNNLEIILDNSDSDDD